MTSSYHLSNSVEPVVDVHDVININSSSANSFMVDLFLKFFEFAYFLFDFFICLFGGDLTSHLHRDNDVNSTHKELKGIF